jgi:hypothetical protein
MVEKKYNSLYEFLEDNLKDIKNPTDEFIMELKKKYWRAYFYHYRKSYRLKFQEVVLRYDKKTIDKINAKKGSQTLLQFLYNCIDSAVESEQVGIIDQKSLGEISLQLMQVIQLLEELIATDNTRITEEILERMEKIEKQFIQTFNDQKQ